MADLCVSILVVLCIAWTVRRFMDGGSTPQRLTAVKRRLWVFLSLAVSVGVHALAAGLDLIPWRTVAIPAVLLGAWLVACRAMVRPTGHDLQQAAFMRRLSPATLAFIGSAILAWWIAVNPLGDHPDEAVASATDPTATTATTATATTDPAVQSAIPITPTAAADAASSGIVMATKGAIVFVGDNGRLTANTGPTSSSGNVALGVKGSQLRSGESGGATTSARQQGGSSARQQGSSSARQQGSSSARRHGNAAGTGTQANPHANGSLAALTKKGKGPRGTSLSGFEDHSVSVLGDDQIVTYDDSNVFINRKGLINANTGDTDSSGLNAVDVGNSTVRAGNSGDGEGGGEDEDSPAEEVAQEAASPATSMEERRLSGSRVAAPAGEDPDDAEESGDEEPTVTPGKGQAFGTVTDEGASSATGKNAFVVGADGYDDVSIRTHGRNDIVTYDDSNVTIGGEGKVNAQIGDSDTGGGVVMGIQGSDVRAGCEGDLCYSANPAVIMAAQILQGSGIHLTPAQQRRLVNFVTQEYSSAQRQQEPRTRAHR